MAIARLTPSTYYLSNSSYLTVTNPGNMYANTDSETYATIQNTRSGTSVYYIYLRGFNFDAIPSDATVNNVTIKYKAYFSGGGVGYYSNMCNGTAVVGTDIGAPTTQLSTITNEHIEDSVPWNTLKSYGDNFGIRINCRRSSSSITRYMYIYGAEIEVEYTTPEKLLVKRGGTWVPAQALYKKVNGVWVQQQDMKSALQTGVRYRKRNT